MCIMCSTELRCQGEKPQLDDLQCVAADAQTGASIIASSPHRQFKMQSLQKKEKKNSRAVIQTETVMNEGWGLRPQ